MLIPSEHHKIKRFKKELTQELKKGLITYQSKTLRELVTQALEAVLKVNQQDMIGQGHIAAGKRKDCYSVFLATSFKSGGDYPEIILLEEILANSFKLKGVGN